MLIVLKQNATTKEIDSVVEKIKSLELTPHISKGQQRTIITVIGDEDKIREQPVAIMPGVDYVKQIMKPYKLVSRDSHPDRTTVQVGNVTIGGEALVVVAGPCSVEGEKEVVEHAKMVKKAGAQIFRAGAFKPRTSPYSFQGLEEQGLKFLAEAREKTGLKIVTEVVDTQSVPVVAEYADILQIGARNMQNFSLLKEVGKTNIPVALKRGMSATIDDVLNAAEYIAAGGNNQIILIERGIRTFDNKYTRNTFDVGAVPVLQQLTHYPVIVDPSHAAGVWDLVTPLAQAGVAAGASGLIVEIHDDPEHAFSDGPQALKPDTFKEMARRCEEIHKVVSAWK